MSKVQITRKVEAALLLALTVPFIGLQAWAAETVKLPATTGAVRVPVITASANSTNTVAPGPSLGGLDVNGPVLGGAGSNEILPPPKLGDPLESVKGTIDTATDALNQTITEGGDIQLGGLTVRGENILIDQNGELTDGTPKDEMIFNPFAHPENEADRTTGLSPVEESAEALDQPDPAAGKTPQEEAADALTPEEPKDGNGSETGTGTTANGGSGSIFQDPTKGGPGLGIDQVVDAAGGKINNRGINVNEEIVGTTELGNRAQSIDVGSVELAPTAGLRNANVESFGAFEGGVSPFAAANGGALAVPAEEAVNAGVVRSFSAPKNATKLGVANLPVEEENLVVRSGNTSRVNNANLQELEVEGAPPLNLNLGKARVNPAAFAELNETEFRAVRR